MVKSSFVLLVFLALTLAACTGTESAIATGIAETQQISQLETAAAGAIQDTQGPAEATLTKTDSEPTGVQVSVTAETNCRKGPSTSFGQVFSLKPGEVAEVVGKNTLTQYWIIISPNGATCWLWGRYAEIIGDADALPEVAAPPTATSAAENTQAASSATASTAPTATETIPPVPQAPTNLTYNRDCATLASPPRWQETVLLSWKDNVVGDVAYRIYKQTQGGSKQLLAILGGHYQVYSDQFVYDQGTGGPLYDTYWVEAFTGGGESDAVVDVYRCP